MPRPDFPKSLPEFNRMFRSERECFDFVIQSRWPGDDDCVCPSCGGTKFYGPKDRLVLVCASCKHLQSATAGTVMHGSRLPLCTWLLAAWLLVTDKRGISAKQMERQLGVTYETAYMVLQRLRAAMVNPDRELLHGDVEMDETFVGGVRHGKQGREMRPDKEGKFIVLGAVEVREGGDPKWQELHRPVRLRLRHVADKEGPTLMAFAREVVEPGSTVITDASPSYKALDRNGFKHRVESTVLGMRQEAVLIHLHLAFSNLKTWMAGTFHGRVESKHLQGYLNEFAFRFNRRNNLFAAFQTVLGIAGRVKGPTQEAIYASGPGRFVHPNPPGRRR